MIANSELLRQRIHNFKQMQERRATFSFGVVYETPLDKLAAIPAMVRAAVEAQPHTRFDRAHFKEYGEYALVFEVVYWMLRPDYDLYMDTQQAINLELYRRFAAEGSGSRTPPTPYTFTPGGGKPWVVRGRSRASCVPTPTCGGILPVGS